MIEVTQALPRRGRTRVKICCIASVDEAWLAIRYGASAIGLVSAMPSGPGPISDDRIAEISAAVPPGVSTVLLTCETRVDDIVARQRRTGANAIQLVDRLEHGSVSELRAALPGIGVLQVVHIRDMQSLVEARLAATSGAVLLLDSGNPALAVKELGGTGRTHDWSISRRIRADVVVPVFLAGGLNPTNVGEAIARVEPYGIDVCSGLRTAGRLDESKLAAFFLAVERADAAHESLAPGER